MAKKSNAGFVDFDYDTNKNIVGKRQAESVFQIPKMGILDCKIKWLLDSSYLKMDDASVDFLKTLGIIYFVQISQKYECRYTNMKQVLLDKSYPFYENYQMKFKYVFLGKDKQPLNFTENRKIFCDFGKLLEKQLYTDITFECIGGELKAHKLVIIARCEFFNKMFENNTIESKTNTVKCAYDVDLMKAFLEYIYTEKVNITLAWELYLAADYYQFQALKLDCVKSTAKNINPKNALSALIFANKCNDAILKNYAIKYISDNITEVAKAKELSELENIPSVILQFILDAFAKK